MKIFGMCIFHKWKTILKEKGSASYTSFGRECGGEIIAVVQECEECGSRRAWVKFVDGRVRDVDPDFILPCGEKE